MKNAIIGLAALALASSAFADATIEFRSRTIPKADGSGVYDVPIWADDNGPGVGTVGAGTLAGGVTVGLFFNGLQIYKPGGVPVQSTLRTASSQQFFTTSSQTATIPGVSPGTSQRLEVRAWQGPSYALAQTTIGQAWAIWSFVSQPLGGTDDLGNTFPTPAMTGWGPESGAGLELFGPIPEPSAIALGALGFGAIFLRRRFQSNPVQQSVIS